MMKNCLKKNMFLVLFYFILYFDKYNDNWAHSPTRSITTPFWWFDVCETIQRWWKRVQGCVDSSEIAVCINWAIAVSHLVSWSFKIETTWCWQVIVHHDGKYSVNKILYFKLFFISINLTITEHIRQPEAQPHLSDDLMCVRRFRGDEKGSRLRWSEW